MDQKSDIKSVNAVARAQAKEDNTITLSTGVVLRGKQVPPLVLVKLMASYPRPKVPTYMSKEMGREMEHPDDPDYIDRVKAWKTELASATLNALILLGTELVKTPKNVPGPDKDDWLQEYSLLGMDMHPDNQAWRYLSWVTLKAAPGADDLSLIKETVGRLSGVPEDKVETAESFPDGHQASG
jgi:hypothetical protein